MRFAPFTLAFLLLCSVIFAASALDDIGSFFSGIMQWLGFAPPAVAAAGCSIEAVASPSGSGQVDGVGAHDCGSTARLTAYPAFGYSLLNWSSSDCAILAAAGQNAVVRMAASGTCHVTAIFAKPEIKSANATAKNEDVTVAEIPQATPPATPVPARCPNVTQEVECGTTMAQTSPLFVGTDGCPRKCRTTPKCTDSTPIIVECSTIATLSTWTEDGCTYVCNNQPAATPAQEQPAGSTNGNNGSGENNGNGGTGGTGGTGGNNGSSEGSGGPPLPDYTVQVIAGGSTCMLNKMIPGPFLVVVSNIGTLAGPSFTYETWLNSATPALHTFGGLQPGEQELVANLQPVCQPGSTTYNAVVDPGNLITESNENNNAASATITAT